MKADMKLLETIVSELKNFRNVEKAVLFGSRARGDCTERSDYDIAIYGGLSNTERACLLLAFDTDLPTLHKIDLIFMCEPHPKKFTDRIEKEGITIYDAKN